MASDGDLLSQFSPVLQYDSRELYFADSAATFTTNAFAGGPLTPYANTLRRRDGTVIARAGRDLTLDFHRPDHYAGGQVVQGGGYLDADAGQCVAEARTVNEDAAV